MKLKSILKLLSIISFLTFLGVIGYVYIYELTLFPIFADEAIYLNWAKRISLGQVNMFISLYDGKPPLYIWLVALGYKTTHQLLWLGRFVSVVSFLAAAIVIWLVLQHKKLSSWRWCTLLLLVSSPFIFFHARMALMDMLLSLFLFSFVVLWTRTKDLKFAFIPGLMLGLAFWAKTTALFLLPLPFISLIIYKNYKHNLRLAIASTLTTLFIILSLKVSSWFPSLFSRSTDFTFTVKEVLLGRMDHIPGNLFRLGSWLISYHNYPILMLGLLGILMVILNKNKLLIHLLVASILFIMPFIFLGKVLAPRYFLFLGLAIPVFAGYFLAKMPSLIREAFLFLSIILVVPNNLRLVLNPLTFTFPEVDKIQYLSDWSSGIGLKPALDYFYDLAGNRKLLVLTEGFFGTLPDGLFVLEQDRVENKNIEIVGVGGPYSKQYFEQVSKSKADLIFYIGNRNRIDKKFQEEMELVQTYSKIRGAMPLDVYQVKI